LADERAAGGRGNVKERHDGFAVTLAAIQLWALVTWPLVFWTTSPARAHQPYIRPIAKIVAPDGRRLRLELLFGDGILSEDPGRGQLRTLEGTVVGRTPVGHPVAGSCVSTDPSTCRVFVGCGPLFPLCAWIPDMASVDWEARTFIGNSSHRTGDPYPEYDRAPAPVGFARDLRHERASASLFQLPFMYAYFGPLLAFSLLVCSWWGAAYITRRARLTGRVTIGRQLLGIALWLAVILLAFPVLLFGTLVSYWQLSFWLTAFFLGCAIALLRRAEQRLFPSWLWAWEHTESRRRDKGEAASDALRSPTPGASLPGKDAPSPQ